MTTTYEHNVLKSATKVTFVCGCWLEVGDEFSFCTPKDLDLSFAEFCAQVEQAHDHGSGPHRLECTVRRTDNGVGWMVSAYTLSPPDPQYVVTFSNLDAVMKGYVPRVCQQCGAAIPRSLPILVTMSGKTRCGHCREASKS
jgi:hypothetical protein